MNKKMKSVIMFILLFQTIIFIQAQLTTTLNISYSKRLEVSTYEGFGEIKISVSLRFNYDSTKYRIPSEPESSVKVTLDKNDILSPLSGNGTYNFRYKLKNLLSIPIKTF